jgi:hypothetical protein
MSSKQIAKRHDYPMGSISSGTMRPEDLIPIFTSELGSLARQSGTQVSATCRRQHLKLVKAIESRIEDEREFEDSDLGVDGCADDDMDSLFDALGCYCAPYFYFGAHPGDGADYGFWLSEDWDDEFADGLKLRSDQREWLNYTKARVYDLAEVPAWFRGEVAVITDHGNVTLYVKTSRGLREIWSVV